MRYQATPTQLVIKFGTKAFPDESSNHIQQLIPQYSLKAGHKAKIARSANIPNWLGIAPPSFGGHALGPGARVYAVGRRQPRSVMRLPTFPTSHPIPILKSGRFGHRILGAIYVNIPHKKTHIQHTSPMLGHWVSDTQ